MVLHILDYVIFGGLVIGSSVIGIYYGWYKKSKTVNQYMLGNLRFIFPVITSVVITFTTPKHMLADPTEVVMYGTQFGGGMILGLVLGCTIFIVFFLPILVTLTGRSLLEYFERRHSKNVRIVVAILLLLKGMTTLPILIYLPSLVIDKMLGVPSIYTSVAIVALCLFYTCLGGLQAVVWTDTLQYGYFFLSVVICICLGVHKIGGLGQVLQAGLEDDRIELLNFGRDIFHDRVNIFSTFSVTLYALSMTLTAQHYYQRMDCIRGRANPKIVVIVSFIGMLISRLGGILTGLIIYAYFRNCHPLLTKEIKKPDQIVPYFVLKMAETLPGLLGLFSAGVIAASLSTMSTLLNTFACSVHDDLVLQMTSRPLSKKKSLLVLQGTTFILGITGLALAPLLEDVVSFLQVIVTLTSITIGPIIGIFISSMANPWVNSKGLVAGAISSVALLLWMSLNFRQLVSEGKVIYFTKFINASGCDASHFGRNITNLSSGYKGVGTRVFLDLDDPISSIGAISYEWYTVIGTLTTILVSCIVSVCTGVEDISKIEPSLIVPQLRWILPKKMPQDQKMDEEEHETVPLNN